MSTNTRIFFNPHVKTKEVFDVILKIAGNEFKFDTNDGTSKINIKEQSSEKNNWFLEPKKNKENNIVPPKKIENNSPACEFFFVDLIGNQYAATYYFESYSNEYALNNEKILSTSSCFWGAAGKRLVDFFGGKVLFCDSADSDNPNSWYVCDNPKHPTKNPNQSPNDYFYQYLNALNNEKILTLKEIKDMESKCSYWTNNDKTLCEYLEKYENAINLNKELIIKPNKSKTKNLKV